MIINESVENFIEICFVVVLFLNAVLYVPQAIKLCHGKIKEAKHLSLFMFGGFNIIQIVTILHGYLHQDYILMIGTVLSLITCFVITIQLIFYRDRGNDKLDIQ